MENSDFEYFLKLLDTSYSDAEQEIDSNKINQKYMDQVIIEEKDTYS